MTPPEVDSAQILRNAIEMEVQGKDFYERAARKMQNQRGRDMFVSLSKQERVHIDILEDQLSKYVHDRVWLNLKQLREEAATTKISVFDDKTIKQISIGPNMNELDVIKVGMEVEQKSVDYYQKARSDIPEKNAKEIFNWLVAQETGHLQILQAEFDNRSKSGFYFGAPEFSMEVM